MALSSSSPSPLSDLPTDSVSTFETVSARDSRSTLADQALLRAAARGLRHRGTNCATKCLSPREERAT